MRTYMRVIAVLALVMAGATAHAADAGIKQPVFLICPHASGYSAWSLYLMVDSSDPKKVLSMGLEKLRKQNSKDSSFDAVYDAQKDEKVAREPVASITAAEFGKTQMRVTKDDALHAGVTPNADGTYTLSISMRVSADDRFSIGDGAKNRSQVVLTYDAGSKQWQAIAKSVYDYKGAKADGAGSKMQGIIFPVEGTGIYRVVGMFDTVADGVKMMERGGD